MARTVIAVYDSVYTAKKAIWELIDLGYPRERIDLFAEHNMDNLAKADSTRSEMVMDELRAGAALGAGIGGALGLAGAVLFLLQVLSLPFLSWIDSIPLEAGAILLAAVVVGAILGSLFSGLIGLGIPEEEIVQYARNVRKEGVTVMVVADWDAVDGTLEVLGRHNPLDLRQKSIEWQKAGVREKKLAERALHVKVSEQDRGAK